MSISDLVNKVYSTESYSTSIALNPVYCMEAPYYSTPFWKTTSICECNNTCNQCIYGYYYDQYKSQCVKCTWKCLTCSSADICLSCDEKKKFILVGSSCVCKDGFYYDNDDVCMPCYQNCKTCSYYSSYCTSCRDDLALINNTCKCEDGYYYDESNNSCVECYGLCYKCSRTSTNCLSCNTLSAILIANSCKCRIGYSYTNRSCTKCSDRCLSCYNDTCICLLYTSPSPRD